jgi:hypothetical protein
MRTPSRKKDPDHSTFMKTLRFFFLLFLIPAASQAQQSLTGLWTGTLSNDSSTIRKDQSFELALTEYRGKVYGYSRSTFIVNDTLFYTMKRIKGKIDGDVCEIKDDELISSNFPGRTDKGVKVTITFHQRKEDSTWHLDGNWKTNKTKNYYSVSGGITLRSEKNLDNSKIFPHLEELGKADDVDFYKEYKSPPVAVAKNNTEKAPVNKPVQQPVTTPKKDPSPAIVSALKEEKKITPVTTPPAPAKPVVAQVTPPAGPAALVAERLNSNPQIINFKSDSLVLALYDNGEIDGDTVSLLLNGEVIIAKQMLKATALKKTIYLPAGTEETTLLLYAENLGKYPPNTGLLVVHDGEDTYQLRFSADLKQNATVVFRRKKN